jgi:hypothetical protein
VSTGNEAASGVEDFVDWLVDDPDTHAIAMIVEQFRKPQRFLAAARRAHAAGKPVVLLHPGKSSAARESAATHTGAMAGDYKLMRAMVARAGVIFAETLEELGDVAEIAARCPIPPSGAAAVLGESGAFKALTLDLAEELGLPLADLHDADRPNCAPRSRRSCRCPTRSTSRRRACRNRRSIPARSMRCWRTIASARCSRGSSRPRRSPARSSSPRFWPRWKARR